MNKIRARDVFVFERLSASGAFDSTADIDICCSSVLIFANWASERQPQRKCLNSPAKRRE